MDEGSPVSPASSTTGTVHSPERKKQKRNKPTLSCRECVERKTKCDRGRPNCLACIKRQTQCRYRHVANILEATNRAMSSTRRITKPPKKTALIPTQINNVNGTNTPDQPLTPQVYKTTTYKKPAFPSTGLLSNIPYTHPSASNVFGIGSEHPFANYWTCQGGLPEVISVLPEKVQSDILLDRYFECVDPVYPMIHRQTFYADYEHFWALPKVEKDKTDGDLIALLFAMLALGTQFVTNAEPKSRQQMAEFYVSAAHQSLRMSSYLNKTSVRCIQAMVLVTYFLINDNHASDGWAFAGILMRQAYAMGLHRDPNIVCPDASIFEKQQRRKLWQAVLLQDTFLTVLLSLPPSATHTDVSVDDLIDSPSSIAPESPTDIMYIHGCWHLANLVQETVCSPRSLDIPICTSPRQKSKLLADFRAVYRSFPDVFRSWTPESLAELSRTNPRFVRQTLFLTSNYFHNIMLVQSSECKETPSSGVHRPAFPGMGQIPMTSGGFNGSSHGTSPTPGNGLSAPMAGASLSPSPGALTPGAMNGAGTVSNSSMSPGNSTIPVQNQSLPGGGTTTTLGGSGSATGPGPTTSSGGGGGGVQKNIRGTLEAAHDAITAFFLLYQNFPADARVWWVFNHRAFLEALCMAEILEEYRGREEGGSAAAAAGGGGIASTTGGVLGGGSSAGVKDPLFSRARADIVQMIDILSTWSDGDYGADVIETRISVLKNYL